MKPFITNSVFLKYKVLQEDNNACSAIALAQIIYIQMEKQKLNTFFPSILFMYYNARIHKNLDEGVLIENLLNSTMEFGIVPETMWEYYVEDPLQKPPLDCYKFGKNFPIQIESIKYESVEYITDFIQEQLLNDKIILCDIKFKETNMDHTILILGMDDKDYIILDSQEINSLKAEPISVLNSQLDRKDIYAISCFFDNKCLPEMLNQQYKFDVYTDKLGDFQNVDLSIYYDHVILGGNISSFYLAEQIKKNQEKDSILIIQNNTQELATNFQNSPIYSKTFDSVVQKNNFQVENITNPLYCCQEEEFMNFFLEPLSLSLSTPNLYYQIVFCNKNESLKNTPFNVVFEKKDEQEIYFEKLQNDFPGIDLSLPYYTILKIILFYYASEFLSYSSDWKWMDETGFGTFLDSPAEQYICLNVSGDFEDSRFCIKMKKEIQYSDSIFISYHQFYNTLNNSSNFVYSLDTTLVPFAKMFIYIKVNGQDVGSPPFLGKGFQLQESVNQYMIFHKNVELLLKEKPDYIKENIYYPILLWDFFQELFPKENNIYFMISNVSYFYLSNESNINDNEIILENLKKDDTNHCLNTNLIGDPMIYENQLSLVNIFQKN